MKPWEEKFYKGGKWKETQAEFMKHKGRMCERCSNEKNPVPARIAHHKIYLTQLNVNDPYIAYAWDNLEALCQTCHNREHHGKNRRRYAFGENGELIPPVSSKK